MDCHEYDLEGATGVVICLVISCFTLKYRTDRWRKAVMCGMSRFHQSTRMEIRAVRVVIRLGTGLKVGTDETVDTDMNRVNSTTM